MNLLLGRRVQPLEEVQYRQKAGKRAPQVGFLGHFTRCKLYSGRGLHLLMDPFWRDEERCIQFSQQSAVAVEVFALL